ncbi:hypothetical protein CLOM_g23139 [Closterium sp. NIES-68]|nr:hypothetical protein CLOM_g23139 [Closterium sp. NIES-68]
MTTLRRACRHGGHRHLPGGRFSSHGGAWVRHHSAHHTRGHAAALQGGGKRSSRPLLVGDLPFGTYEQSPQQAVESAVRLLKEGNMDAVKIEAAYQHGWQQARAVSEGGYSCDGARGAHPAGHQLAGGLPTQGRSAASALKVVQHAQALQEAGCFAVVLECMACSGWQQPSQQPSTFPPSASGQGPCAAVRCLYTMIFWG